MMDHAELDFGIYRIMNQKRADIMDFLENRLLKQVGTSLDVDEKEVEKLQNGTPREFRDHHVLFQKDSEDYIEELFKMI